MGSTEERDHLATELQLAFKFSDGEHQLSDAEHFRSLTDPMCMRRSLGAYPSLFENRHEIESK